MTTRPPDAHGATSSRANTTTSRSSMVPTTRESFRLIAAKLVVQPVTIRGSLTTVLSHLPRELRSILELAPHQFSATEESTTSTTPQVPTRLWLGSSWSHQECLT